MTKPPLKGKLILNAARLHPGQKSDRSINGISDLLDADDEGLGHKAVVEAALRQRLHMCFCGKNSWIVTSKKTILAGCEKVTAAEQ
jgi:hypothetical protein